MMMRLEVTLRRAVTVMMMIEAKGKEPLNLQDQMDRLRTKLEEEKKS